MVLKGSTRAHLLQGKRKVVLVRHDINRQKNNLLSYASLILSSLSFQAFAHQNTREYRKDRERNLGDPVGTVTMLEHSVPRLSSPNVILVGTLHSTGMKVRIRAKRVRCFLGIPQCISLLCLSVYVYTGASRGGGLLPQGPGVHHTRNKSDHLFLSVKYPGK